MAIRYRGHALPEGRHTGNAKITFRWMDGYIAGAAVSPYGSLAKGCLALRTCTLPWNKRTRLPCGCGYFHVEHSRCAATKFHEQQSVYG